MPSAVIIPARFASTRLPGKPLLDRTGQPLICHVIDLAKLAKLPSHILVATDDRRIFDAVAAHGAARPVMTRADHPNGTCRIAEAAATLPADVDLIVNVQGDEPELPPEVIDQLIERLRDDPTADMATVITPFAADEDPSNPNIVKVVITQQHRAIYFSRALIPFDRDPVLTANRKPQTANPYLKHLGIYAYRRAFLDIYAGLPPTPAEQLEKLEQLRAIEHGHAIACITTAHAHPGIDTPEQYDAFVARFRSKSVY
ncbi:MAG: 3-deoxy-manno-octulosonate cytidylyltransferase [Phycisphaeraceae bacterium]